MHGSAVEQVSNQGDVRVVPIDPVRSIDIDSEEDFRLAEEVIQGIKST